MACFACFGVKGEQTTLNAPEQEEDDQSDFYPEEEEEDDTGKMDPLPEETTIYDLENMPLVEEAFRSYCEKTHSSENYLFWKDILQYRKAYEALKSRKSDLKKEDGVESSEGSEGKGTKRKMSDDASTQASKKSRTSGTGGAATAASLRRLAQDIFDKFFVEEAEYEISIDSDIVESMKEQLSKDEDFPNPSIFRDAFDIVEVLLQNDTFTHFLHSKHFKAH
eukprot:CAMPEP_0177660866 /NCGR_PEP_ID=MMETSP0447-20121125/18312_1 /TAXON_ID=0 /ORGANISM="Stygamoeba regulata, Strain BSH-02190019" /LENGTH=221 /DNA_ID=CAMNT_0019166047 /DNA_START=219 /DNA_END=884 /DNA_ORIENTATION=+